jgi:hypothetical protein
MSDESDSVASAACRAGGKVDPAVCHLARPRVELVGNYLYLGKGRVKRVDDAVDRVLDLGEVALDFPSTDTSRSSPVGVEHGDDPVRVGRELVYYPRLVADALASTP